MHSVIMLLEALYRTLDSVLSRNPPLCLFLISGGLFLGSSLLNRPSRLSLGGPNGSFSKESIGDGTA
jgi:hypothetical protein